MLLSQCGQPRWGNQFSSTCLASVNIQQPLAQKQTAVCRRLTHTSHHHHTSQKYSRHVRAWLRKSKCCPVCRLMGVRRGSGVPRATFASVLFLLFNHCSPGSNSSCGSNGELTGQDQIHPPSTHLPKKHTFLPPNLP